MSEQEKAKPKTLEKVVRTNNPVVIRTTLWQPNDSVEEKLSGQTLDIELRNAGAGNYAHLKTEGWSIEPQEFQDLQDLTTQMIKEADKNNYV